MDSIHPADAASYHEPSTWQKAKKYAWKSLNFYRSHLLVFTFTPLLMSIIFWAVNGETKIAYIDSLFLSYSAFTGTGLQAVDLSSTTPLQQAILWILMFSGSPIVASWVMVYIRKKVLEKYCKDEFVKSLSLSQRVLTGAGAAFKAFRTKDPVRQTQEEDRAEKGKPQRQRKGSLIQFNPRMVRRVDTGLKRITPSGEISVEPTPLPSPRMLPQLPNMDEAVPGIKVVDSPEPTSLDEQRPATANQASPSPLSSTNERMGAVSEPSQPTSPFSQQFPRSVGFDAATMSRVTDPDREGLRKRLPSRIKTKSKTYSEFDIRPKRPTTSPSIPGFRLPHIDERFAGKHGAGYGGFPGPFSMIKRLFRMISPKLEKILLPRIKTYPTRLVPTGSIDPTDLRKIHAKEVPYFSFDAIVGKNSMFHDLTEEQLEELGGLEYKALRLLLKIIPAYYIGFQAVGWAIFAPSLSQSRYTALFANQHRYIQSSWAGVFLSTSALTNSGMSLVDTGFIPFQRDYQVLIFAGIMALAGNTAFPICLRFFIWLGTKTLSRDSDTRATLHFLLDHPRRCFLYLFPSYQTWFLCTIILTLNSIDLLGFLLFDIGNAVFEVIPVGTRIALAFLQATSIRCAGFSTVSLSLVSPATQVLFVIMMYIAPYPIALAVRSTNVYEDRALGVYEEAEEESEDESVLDEESKFMKAKGSRSQVWGKYLAWHVKRQLAFDLWWLVFAWLLISLLERKKIRNTTPPVFDLFGILFELVSAWGSVGASIGLSDQNYSLSGSWRPVSKVVIVIVMLFGRHRGLPNAVDRAVILPKDFKPQATNNGPEVAEYTAPDTKMNEKSIQT